MAQFNEEDRKWLYDTMQQHEIDTGSYDDFKKSLDNDEDRNWYYEKSKELGLDVGSKEDFDNMMWERRQTKPQPRQQAVAPKQNTAQVLQQSIKQRTYPVSGKQLTDLDKQRYQRTINSVNQTVASIPNQFDKFSKRQQKRQGLTVPKRITLGESGNLQKEQHINPVTGEMEKTYVTSQGNEYDTKALANMEQLQIDKADSNRRYNESIPGQLEQLYKEKDRLNQLLSDRVKEIEERENKQGFFSRLLKEAGRAANSDKLPDNTSAYKDLEEDEEYSSLMSALRKNREAIKTLEDQKEGKTNEFWHSFANDISNGYNFSFGGKATLDDIKALTNAQLHVDEINRKRSKGEQLTRDEQVAEAVLRNAEWDRQVQEQYGDEYGAWARAGKMGATSLDLMFDFMAMGGQPMALAKGIYGSIVNGGERILGNLATKGLGKYMLKATGATLGSMVAGAEITNTVQLPKTAGNIMKQMQGDVFMDENGNYVFGHYEDGPDGKPVFVQGGNSFLGSALDVERQWIAENASEVAGTFLGGAGKAVGKAAMKALDKIGLSKIANYITSLSGKQWYKSYTKALETMGFNGAVEEPMEEYTGDFFSLVMGDASGITGDKEGRGGWLDTDKHVDIWLGCATMAGILNAPRLIGTGASTAKYYRYKHAADKASQVASTLFDEEEWQILREAIDEATNAQIKNVATSIVTDANYTEEQKAAALKYIENVQEMRGYNIGRIAAERDNTPEEEVVTEAEHSFAEGYNTTEPQDMHDAKIELEVRRDVLKTFASDMMMEEFENNPIGALQGIINNENWDGGEKQMAIDYVNARMTYDGMLDGVRDDIDSKVEYSNATIDKRRNPEDMMIHPATLKSGQQVYVIGGNIVLSDDGTSINTQASVAATGGDGMILTSDAETGKVQAYSVDDFQSAEAPIDAEQMKQEAAETIRQSVSLEAANNIDGVLPFQQGDEYQLLDEQGIEHTVQVVENLGDGTVAVLLDGSQEPAVIPEDLIQQQANAYNAARVEEEITATEQPIEEVAEDTESAQLDNADAEAGQEETGADEAPASALSQIPVMQDQRGNVRTDRNGNPAYVWHLAPVETTADALTEMAGGDMLMARDTAASMIGKAKGDLEKARALKVKGDDPITIMNSRQTNAKAVADAQEVVKYWQDVNQELQRRMTAASNERRAAEEAAKSEEQKAAEAAAEAQRQQQQAEIEAQRRREQIEKDRKERTRPYAPLQRAKNEVKGDIFAEQLLENVEPRDLQEWVSSLLRPHSIIWNDEKVGENTITGLQSELGLPKSEFNRIGKLLATRQEGGKPFAEIVDEIHEGLPEAMKEQYTDQDVRNTLIDLFGEGNIDRMMHLTEEHRIEEARNAYQENMRREEDAELDAWAAAYHLTPEERETFEDYMQQPPTEPEQEIINQIIAEHEQDRTSKRVDSQLDSETAAAGIEGSESQVQQDVEAAGNVDNAETTTEAAETTGSEQTVADNTLPIEREVVREYFRQIGADDVLADRMSDYEVEQLNAMIEDWEAYNDDYGYLMQQHADALKSKDKATREKAQSIVNDAQQKANEAFEPIQEYVEGLNTKYGIDSEEPFEGAIPTPDIDAPRFLAIRQALIDGYKNNDVAAIQKAAGDMQQYVDEGLNNVEDENDMVNHAEYYDGTDPELLADQYITRVFWDRYLDNDEDQEYMRTGLRADMRKSLRTEEIKNDVNNPTYEAEKDVTLQQVIQEVSNEIKTRPTKVVSTEDDIQAFKQLGVGDEILKRIREDMNDAETVARYEEDLGVVILFGEKMQRLGLTPLKKKAADYHEHIHALSAYGYSLQDIADVAQLIDYEYPEFAAAVRKDHADKDITVQNEEVIAYFIQGYIEDGRLSSMLDGTFEDNNADIANAVNNIFNTLENGRKEEPRAAKSSNTGQEDGELVSQSEVPLQLSETGTDGETTPIQGLESYSEDTIKNIVRRFIEDELNGTDIDIDIVDIKPIGSRTTGTANPDSDLDVLVEYKGDISEDGLYNILADADEPLTIEGITVDINPITEGKSGTIAQFLERNKGYKKEPTTEIGTTSTSEEIATEEAKVDTNPSEAQKEAGNYQKGHIKVDGYDITIENPKGSVRRGTDADGKQWEQEMHNTYGYIKGTEGVDGDHIDVFLSDNPTSGQVWVVDQVNPKTGEFDEHKVMYGFDNATEATQAYLSNYEDGWKGLGTISGISREEFKKWVESSHRKTKPFRDYAIAKSAEAKKAQEPKRLVSDDRMEELKQRLREKLGGQLNVGVDPEVLAIGAEMAVGYIERGVTKFADFAKAMLDEVGDFMRPYIKSFYNAVRDMPEAEPYADQMDDYDTVRKFDLSSFDNEQPTDVFAKAEQIANENKVEQQTKKIQQTTQLDLFGEPVAEQPAPAKKKEPAKKETPSKAQQPQQRKEPVLRPLTEEDLDKAHPVVYYQGRPYSIIAVMRSGEQISATQFSKPVITSVMLTNGKSVKPDELQVEDTNPQATKKKQPNTAWWSDANRPESLNPNNWETYVTDEAKNYFEHFKSADGKVDFTKWAHPNLAYITAAAWDGAAIPVEELMQIPEVAKAQNSLKEGSLSITDEEKEQYAQRLLDAEHGSAVYNERGKVADYSGPVKQDKQAFFVIGRPAGGKSSVFADPLSRDYHARIIDADIVKPWLNGYDGGNGAGYVQKASSDVMERALEIAAERGDNVVIPKIGGGSVVEMAAALRLAGYNVQLLYNDVSEETSIMRAASRFAETGRYLSLQYLTSIKNKPTEIFIKFAKETIGKYLYERTEKDLQNIRGRLQRLLGELAGSREGLWQSLAAQREGERTSERTVQTSMGGRELQDGGDELSLLKDAPLFGYSEWKSNDVAIGEKPKEIWNSESGKPLPETTNNENDGRKTERVPEAGRMQRQGDSTQGAGRENRPVTGGISSGAPQGNTGADNSRLDSDLSSGGNERQGDSRVQKGEQANSRAKERTERSGRTVQQLERPENPKNLRNNHAERGTDYAPHSVNARIEANIKAIETMQQLIANGEEATKEQQAVLRQFSGWGGLGKAFDDEAYSKRLRELLGEEAYQQAVMSRTSAYYTPASVITPMWDIARAMGFNGGKVLEGSAGIGNIIGLMPEDMSERSDIQAVEIDSTTGNILKLLYPDAQVDIQGFETTNVPNGSVDLAITNVPFVTGLRVKDTTGDKDLSKKFPNIHDFCIAKNVRKLKEGGIGIFITSSGTLDNSKKLRDWIVSDGNADVVGAFRLNNNTFGGAGVTSDIIVIRKRINGKKSPNAIDVSVTSGERTAEYDTGEEKKVKGHYEPVIKQIAMDYNKYFVEHPEQMAGEMMFNFEKGNSFRATSKSLYPVAGKDQAKMLDEWAKSFADKDWEAAAETEQQDEQPEVYEQLGPDVKEGSMVLSNGQLCVAQFGKAVPLKLNDNKVKGHTKQECFKSYQAIKQALADVLEYQTNNESNDGLQPLLDKLNKTFDSFVKTYGHLPKNNQLAWLKNDVDFPSVFALETYSETSDIKTGKRIPHYQKTDIFSQRVVAKEKAPQPDNVKDGIIASIYMNGRVDIPWIAESISQQTGQPMTEQEVRDEIIKQGLGFENPTTREIEVSYEYLSGNVREKLQQAIDNNTDGRYDVNIRALEKAKPNDIPAHLIDFSIGSSWLPAKLFEDYVKDKTDISVTFTPAGGTWFMKAPYYINEEKNRTAGVYSQMLRKNIFGTDLIEAAMTNKTITVSETHKKWDGSTETTTDKEATQACATKIDEIRQDFKDWAKEKMQADSEMAQDIERKYNDTFNNYVPLTISDEFTPKHFPGASSRITLNTHQAKAAIRGINQPLLLAHEVGSGKTFTMITTAMEMRRLGTAKKPMIVVQNATLGQFVSEAKVLYPNAKILTLDEKDHTAEGRKNFYAKIKYNDWDMIVVPQSVFERIPDSEERQMAFVHDKIEEKMLVLEKMKEVEGGSSSMIVRSAEKEIEKLEEQLVNLSATIADKRKKKDEKKEAVRRQNAEVKALEMLDREVDDVENFDDMGIDALLVDEAHEYKHLGFATAMQRGVKGVDPSYSKKAQGVFLKTQAVLENNNGRNVIFATGTPISNTAAEIWTFMRYLMPADTMKDYGIYYFDDFVRNFGNLTQMLEFTTSGKFKENNRFAGYINLPELVRIWSSVADTVLNKEVEEEREKKGIPSKLPALENGEAQDIYLPQTKALRSVMKYVKGELERFENMSGKEKKENSHIPLTMYGIAKAAAVDARLVVDDAVDEPMSKTNEAVRQTLRSLEDSKSYKGTVALFADNYQNKRTGFNIYEDIRKKLIEAGVPEEQIVIIKSGMSVKKKLEIFDKVNSGDIRVIMGSTFTLGTGVNIQERLFTLIHLDAPNRPMDYTQRNGRILRQGNLHKEMGIPVRVLRFGVEDSLDVTAYQRLKTKGAIADSIMHGRQMMENSMENRALEEEEDVFGDTVAQLSGSEYAMLKNQAEKDVRKYEAKKKQWEADQAYVHSEIPKTEALIREMNKRVGELEGYVKDIADINKKNNTDAEHPLPITIGKKTYKSVEEMGDFLKDFNKNLKEKEIELRDNPSTQSYKSQLTVNVGGVDFIINTELTVEVKEGQGQLFTAIRRLMTYDCPTFGLKDESVHQSLLRNAIEDITKNVMTGKDFEERLQHDKDFVEQQEKKLAQMKERNGKPFQFTEELQKAHEHFDEYSELMKKELEEKEAKYAEMDKNVETAGNVEAASEEDEEEETESREDRALYRESEDEEEEIEAIIRQAKANGTYMLAPNGKPTNLTERQWAQVRTEAFKEWFGDWENEPENASKVVDENGEPKVMYHGTRLDVVNNNTPFWTFRPDQHFGTKGQAKDKLMDDVYHLQNPKIYEVFLNIRNPQRRNDADQDYLDEKDMTMREYWEQSIERAKGREYDGIVYLNEYEDKQHPADSWIAFEPNQVKSATENVGTFRSDNEDIRYRLRENEPPTNTGVGYKVFVVKDGQLYPPMVANPNGEATPVGEWLDADAAPIASTSKTGRPQVKAGGKGTQGGSGQLAYRPGWHLGTIPYAIQFNRVDAEGNKTLFPSNFVWAEVEYANDIDYQQEAHDEGVNANGKYQHSLAGLKHVPVDGSYRYRTNPNPNTDEWIITGAMKVNRILKPSEVDELVKQAGREPQPRQEGAVTDADVEKLNQQLQERALQREGAKYVSLTSSKRTPKEQRNAEAHAQRRYDYAKRKVDELISKLGITDKVIIMDTPVGLNSRDAKAKGFYKDGKIVIIMSNHNSPDDVIATLLHEAVAHYGLRQLFGKNFDQFLRNVLENGDLSVKAAIYDKVARMKAADKKAGRKPLSQEDYMLTATEEYLASLAEDTDFERATDSGWFQKIKQLFLDMLKRVGLADFKEELTDNELRYILWRSYKNLSEPGHYRNVFQQAEDVTMQNKLGVGNYAKRVRLQKTGKIDTSSMVPTAAEQRIEDAVPSVLKDRFDEEEIRRKVKKLTLNEALEAYNRIDSQMRDEQGRNLDDHFEAIKQEHIHNNGLEGIGPVMAKSLEDAMEKYGSGMVELRWELLDRINELGGSPFDDRGNRSLHRDDEEETPDIDAGTPTMEESIINGLLDISRQNRENVRLRMDAIRAIGGNLSKLRSAMARQREYDKETVYQVVRLARTLMEKGNIDSLTRGEVKKLVGLIAGAAGKEDIDVAAKKVVDLLINNQLRQMKTLLGKQLSIRGTKINGKGVEVQGKLDVEGARMADALKQGMQMTEQSINERLEDCLDRMGNDDETISKNAAIDYQGYLLAKQYVQDIKQSEEEERNLKYEITVAKEDYKAGRQTRNMYEQFVDSIEETILNIQMERLGKYYDLMKNIGTGLRESVQRASDWRDQESKRAQEIQHNANSDMEGRQYDEHHKPSWMERAANWSFVRFFMKPLATFDQMLRLFGRKNVNGEGYLWNRFMNGYTEASDKEWRNLYQDYKDLDAKVSEVFGKNMKWSDLFSIERKMDGATVSFWDGGEIKEHKLTPGNLLYIYMANKMADGRMKLRKMGITDEHVEEIKEHLDPRFIELADWLQNEYLPMKRKYFNAVHERMFGASMAAIDNYFPLVINKRDLVKEEEVGSEDYLGDENIGATITGAVIKRTKNAKALDITNADAFDVILSHLQQMEHWAAYAEMNKDLGTLLSYKHFRNQVLNMSTLQYGSGKNLWVNFKRACAVVSGAYRPKIDKDSVDTSLVNLAKGVTAAKIAFRPYTALKQLLSYPAYLSEANIVELVKSTNPVGAVKAFNWAMDNLPGFSKRWQSRIAGDTRLQETDIDWGFWKNKLVHAAGKMGMTPNAFIDALTVAMGAKAIYETKRKQYLKDGYSEEQAEQKAKNAASISFNETQQSSENAFLSAMQLDRTVASVAFTVFRNASMGYQRRLTAALRNISHMFTPGYKDRSIAFMTKQMMRDGLTEEQANKAANRAYNRAWYRNIADTLLFGFVMQMAWNLGPYLPYLLGGDDDDEKDKMLEDAAMHALAGGVEGVTGGQIISELYNLARSGGDISNYQFNLLPLMSDIQTATKHFKSDSVAAWNDVLNILVQSGIGVNPQTITDAFVAIMDAADGNLDTGKEIAMLIMRMMQAPQSAIDKMYIDELNMSGEEARKLSVEELAQRYARYKRMKNAPLTGWAYRDEEERKVEDKYIKRFNNMIKERLETKTDEDLDNLIQTETDDYMREQYEKESKKRVEAALDEMNLSEMMLLFDNSNSDSKRKVIARRISKQAGASKDPYGNKSDKEYVKLYQQLRNSVDVYEDALLYHYQEDAKAKGDEERADEISKERSNIRDNVRDMEAGFDNDNAQSMQYLRQDRRQLIKELQQ